MDPGTPAGILGVQFLRIKSYEKSQAAPDWRSLVALIRVLGFRLIGINRRVELLPNGKLLNRPIQTLNLSVRTTNVLLDKPAIRTVGELAQCTAKMLSSRFLSGPTVVQEVRTRLAEHCLNLKEE